MQHMNSMQKDFFVPDTGRCKSITHIRILEYDIIYNPMHGVIHICNILYKG